MVNCDYLIEKLRKITEEPSGYFKFGQTVILLFSISIFSLILIYNMFIKTRDVSSIDVFFAVIVGTLGTIVGLFFGAKAEYFISQSRKAEAEKIKKTIPFTVQVIKKLSDRIQELEKIIKERL